MNKQEKFLHLCKTLQKNVPYLFKRKGADGGDVGYLITMQYSYGLFTNNLLNFLEAHAKNTRHEINVDHNFENAELYSFSEGAFSGALYYKINELRTKISQDEFIALCFEPFLETLKFQVSSIVEEEAHARTKRIFEEMKGQILAEKMKELGISDGN